MIVTGKGSEYHVVVACLERTSPRNHESLLSLACLTRGNKHGSAADGRRCVPQTNSILRLDSSLRGPGDIEGRKHEV